MTGGAGLFGFVTALFAAAPAITIPPASQTVFLGDPVTFRVSASGTLPLGYQWFRDGAVLSGSTTSELAFSTATRDHNARFTVQVTNSAGSVTSAPAILAIDFGMPGPAQTNRLVEVTNVWRYNVNKTNLPSNWTAPGYPDSAWPQGAGLLYLEESALPAPKLTALPITAGSTPTTCYFRTLFTNSIVNPFALNLVVNTVVDDGIVCYLNGQKAFRLGVADGDVTYDTLSDRTVGNAAWEGPAGFEATNLLAGANVLAAEVHQVNTSSTDVVMGLTLDAVWQPRFRDSNAPVVVNVLPAPGETVTSLSQIEVQFSEPVQGVDAADLLVNGAPATNVVVTAPEVYVFEFPAPTNGTVSVTWSLMHGITDRSANSNSFAPAGFTYFVGPVSTAVRLSFYSVRQSTDASSSSGAIRAVDGANATSSLTQNLPGSYWAAELSRTFPLERIELVNRAAPDDKELAGLTLRLFNIEDQIVFETGLTNPGPSGIVVVSLPAGLSARSLWIGLPGTNTNGAGNYRIGLAEVRLFGSASIPYGPPAASNVAFTNAVKVWQSSEYGGYPAENAVDGDTGNFTHTDNVPDSYWMADLGKTVAISRVEIVNRSSCCDDRLAGLVLRIFDGASNSVNSAILTNPGLGGTWIYTPPAGTVGRWLRVGLEGGQMNGGGNYYVTLAEARVFCGATNVLVPSGTLPVPVTNNLASFKPACMLRLDESVPVASNANDDNYSTETKTTVRTVDGYWEVDLGNTFALYGVRAIAASGIGYRLTNTIVRLYDAAHESVFAKQMSGAPDVFDMDLNGPVFARYVRVGLEDKQRTDPAGGIEFYIGFREVEVFGRPTNQVGVLSFATSISQVAAGQSATLSWAVDDVRRVEIRPALGSVGGYTATSGSGSVTVTPATSTEYILIASNTAGLFTRAVGVQVGSSSLPVRLSEVVAENKYSLKDGDGDAPDWVELRNTGDSTVNLQGWSLSDDPAQPMKWMFPATNIGPHSTLIVFVSGRSTSFDSAGNLHASFRLEKNGGSLVLTAKDGVTTVDSVSYPELDADLAYGRNLEGQWTFIDPTPGAVNTAPTYLGWLKPLDWSHARGFYDVGFTLRLTNNSPGASVLFSLDGSTPTLSYMGGIAISRATSVRAQAVRPGYRPARIQTKTFLFVNDVITSSVMNTAITQDPAYAARMRPGLLALPSIAICVPGQPEYEEKEGSLEVLWPNGGEPVQVNCGISRFGNAWTKYAKRSFRMKCRTRYGDAKLSVPLFDGFDRGVIAKTSFDALDLRSGSQDMVERGFYMAGRFVEDSMLDMGSLNPHGRFVHVYINGVYWGQYDCRELLVNHFLADYLGGTEDDYVTVRGNDNVSDDFVIGAPDPPNLEPWDTVLSYKNSFNSVRSRLDVSHLIDFMLLWNYGNCESEYRCCGPINPGTGFKFWIADADGFLRTSALGLNRTDRTGPGGLFGGLVAENNSDFKTLLADRIYRHFFNQGALTPAANTSRLAQRMQEIHDSLLAECARWGYRTPANWESAAAGIRSSLFPTRTSQLVGYLRAAGLYPAFDPPTFNQYGGLVTNGFKPTLSATSGTIYFTLDGTDPRLAGGGISPAARVWSAGAVTITNDLTLNARVRNASGQWSALAQPSYLLAARRPPTAKDLLVTEINYNPAGSDEYEFVELYNASTNLLDLSNISLSNAVRFIFPKGYSLAPGGFVLVVESSTAFAARYQAHDSPYYFPDIIVGGQWVGGLNNGADTISLLASNGLELSSVPYQTSGDWPERADGQGSSIELRSLPSATNSDQQIRAWLADGRSWSSSSLFNGSPGRFDTFVRAVRVSEILPHTDLGSNWLELLNTSDEVIDLIGCTLTDDMAFPAQWSFPTNSVLSPGQFAAIAAAQLPFTLSALGGQVFLLQLSGTNVVRFLDSVDFPAVEPGVSMGLFQRSDGAFDFTELRANTPAAPNALPRVGPVVISEVMYHPNVGHAQYIELANITSAPVPLYDPAHPANIWKIDGIGDFSFPPNTVLEPCASLIVCATNPATFREQYGLAVSVPVLGPWGGRLDDDGETLKLLRPGAPEMDGTVPYYRVDHIAYRTNAPWPETGIGAALERFPLQSYGNDPSAWRTTPSNGTPGIPAANRAPVITVTGSQVVPQQVPATWSLAVADLDAPWQTVSLSPLQLPEGSVFDPSHATLSWTPSAVQPPGQYTAEFSAADSSGCADGDVTLRLDIQVTAPLALTAQYIEGALQLAFPVTIGETYHLEFCTDLSAGMWQPVAATGEILGGVITFSGLQISQGGAGFYRVRWER